MKFARDALAFLLLCSNKTLSHFVQVFALFHQCSITIQTCNGTNACRQFITVNRLAQKIVRAYFDALKKRGAVIKSSEKNDRHLSKQRRGADTAANLVSIHARHHHIEKDQIRLNLV